MSGASKKQMPGASSVSRVVSRLSPTLCYGGMSRVPRFRWTTVDSVDAQVQENPWSTILPRADEMTPLAQTVCEMVDRCRTRLVTFGEQHHQPTVLKAQLQTLHALAQRHHHLVLVLEHFNVCQQPLLDAFGAGTLSGDDLVAAYAESREGFRLAHYMPLLSVCRELEVRVVGGFPDRRWASTVFRKSVGDARAEHADEIPKEFDRWDDVTTLSTDAVSYLESMTRGRPPTTPPETSLVDREGKPLKGGRVAHAYFEKGLLAAQSLKDTFMAWVIDEIVGSGDDETLVLAIAGLGHCEFGLGFVEKLRRVKREEVVMVASKDLEMTEFDNTKPRTNPPSDTDPDILAHIIVPYEAAEVD
ncbi:hypothetical protein PYCC9005_000495 [Savitreella phatthalungensis]